jgi:tRNA nucleotidyltransferase/poly(A) polymerase
MRYLYPIIFLVIIVGCSDYHNDQQILKPSKYSAQQMIPTNDTFFAYIQYPDAMSQKDVNDLLKLPQNKAAYLKSNDLIKSLQQSNDWHSSHEKTKQFLFEIQGQPLESYFKQYFAQAMLKQTLLSSSEQAASLDPKRQEAVASYLEMLVQSHNLKDIVLYANALTALKGYWSEAQIADVAQQCLKSNSASQAQMQQLANRPDMRKLSLEEQKQFVEKQILAVQKTKDPEQARKASEQFIKMRTEQLSVQPPSQVGSMVSQKIIPDNSSRVNFESIQKLAVLAGVQVHKSSNMKEFLEKISQTKK